MKKLKTVIFSLGLISTLLSAGCAGKGSLEQSTEGKGGFNQTFSSGSSGELQIELSPITSVQEYFSEDANELKVREFDNISFENTYFSFTEANELFTLEYKITNFDISPDEAYDFMCKKLDELFPGLFSDEEKEKEIRFYDVSLTNSENKQRFNEYPTLEQYKAMQEKGYPYLLTNHATTGINNAGGYANERYLDVMNGVLWGFDDGYLAKASGFDRNLNSFDILSNFPVVYRTENLESSKTFHLSSGDISIVDAVKSAEKCLSELELSERELPLKMRVQNVNVIDIGNSCCAFYFGFVPEYKGVKYNCILPDDTVFGFSTLDDNTNEREACGEAIMYEKDKLSRYRFLNPVSMYDIAENDPATSIIPLEKAAEISSEYLTAGIEFNVLSVSAVYKSFSDIDYGQAVDKERYETRSISVRPCWRFVLKPLTGSTDRLYYIFVDMLTGAPYRTVQLMESGVQYD